MKLKTIKCMIAAALAIGMVGAVPAVAPVFDGITVSAAAVQPTAGKYTVNIQLKQFGSDSLSMGNASMKSPATLIVNADGTARIEIEMQSLKYLGRDGYLGQLRKITKVLAENKYHYPTEIETEDAEVLEEFVGVYDAFNNPDSTAADSHVAGKWYPKKLSIPVVDGEDDILVQVYVPVMESIMTGGGTKFARLVIDYTTLERIAEPLTFNASVSADTIVKGDKVTVNATAAGGAGDYQYAFYYKKATAANWTAAQKYSTKSTVSIKPAAAVPYDILVKVKDSSGKVLKKTFTVNVNAKLTNTTTLSADTVKKGDTVTVNASAAGGLGGYQYMVLYKRAESDKWITAQKYSTNTAVNIKCVKVTDYNICVKVKDASGKLVKSYYTVQVSK